MKGSIFRTSLLLALGGALALAVASTALVLLNPVAFAFPLSTYEVARLLRNEPVARTDLKIATTIVARPNTDGLDPASPALRTALARQLDVDEARVVLAFEPDSSFENWRHDGPRAEYERLMGSSVRLYGGDPRFTPLIFRPFHAGLRLPDGRWRMVVHAGPSPGPQLQWGIVKWIALALLMIVPIAWFFSERIARPIRAFAAAADRIGGGGFERIPERGPQEIRTAARALNDMQTRIQAYVSERTAVAGAVAHDLRTPLARLQFVVANADPALRERIMAEIAAMERMIAVTMDYVHSDSATAGHDRVDLRLVVESTIDDFADMGRDASIEPGPPVVVTGDAVLLGRLFANIVDNALTYGERARARLTSDEESVLVEVDDDGPGLSNADSARVFEPFYRVEKSRNAATGGIGLGLAIVRALATAHGGTVALGNRAEGGLRVSVTLPLAARS